MRASVPVIPSHRAKAAEHESFDVQEIAAEAVDALEAYQRAPWRHLSERTRMAKLRRAIELLHRIEDLETGRIPTKY